MTTSVAILAFFGVFSVSDAPNASDPIRSMIENDKKATDLLKTIVTEKDAKAALPKLKELGREHDALEKVVRALPKGRDKSELPKSPRISDFDSEYKRLAANAGVLKILGEEFPIRVYDDLKSQIAKLQIRSLASKADYYRVLAGGWPRSLVSFADTDFAGKVILKKEELIDPWGREYEYEHSIPEKPPVITSKGPLHWDSTRRLKP